MSNQILGIDFASNSFEITILSMLLESQIYLLVFLHHNFSLKFVLLLPYQ